MLYSTLIGIVVGWLASTVYRGYGFGVIGNILVGVIGALLGGFLFNLLSLTVYGRFLYMLMSLVGAIVLLWLLGYTRRRPI